VLPVLVEGEVGGWALSIAAYPVALALAAVVAVLLLSRAAPVLGVGSGRLLAWGALAVAAGLIGARALAVALNLGLYTEDPWLALEPSARGFALYGGALAGAVVMVLAARRLRLGFGELADAGVLPFAAGVAIVRVGCFLAGCCAGTESNLPWAVAFPAEVPAGGLLGRLLTDGPEHVHPTQLYELVAVLAAAAVSGAVARRAGMGDGGRASVFAALFLGFRALDQVVRAPSPGAVLPPEAVSFLYGTLAVGGLVVALAIVPRGRRQAEAGLAA
jgi:phosphatidylglycerol:prolipoprotein diacylglycerol transferase